MKPNARARIYKNPNSGHWTVVRYWRGTVVHLDVHRRSWNDARVAALRWVNG